MYQQCINVIFNSIWAITSIMLKPDKEQNAYKSYNLPGIILLTHAQLNALSFGMS